MKTLLYRIIQMSWGLPQTLLGFILYLRYKTCPHFNYKGSIVTRWPRGGGLSLGMFTFIEKYTVRYDYLYKHEYGHTIQSLILGPFYLFLIGIPSFIWASLPSLKRKRLREGIPYDSFIVERSADRFGGNTHENRNSHRPRSY